MAARRTARVVAQAKVNLFLRILAREAGGHHQLETLFQRLELGDDVAVHVDVPGRALDCRGADVGPAESNLAWRAALAYAERAGWPEGFAIEIDKRIPVGGGLGGGSADAGAVLRALDALNPRPLGQHALLQLAAPLGADVPFLACEAPLALAWGRGERMLALPPLPARRAHLALFDEGVHTGTAFGLLAEHRAKHGGDAPRPILWAPGRLARWDDVALVASNDFEAVVLPWREDVAAIREMFGEVGRRVDALREEWGAEDAAAEAADSPAAALADDGDPADAPATDGDSAPFAFMTGSGATVVLLSPLAGVAVEFAIEPPDEGDPPATAGLTVVETRTATRVAAVSVSG